MNLSQGSLIGHYEVVGSLGAGGMGEVYRARDTKLKREVALKILPEHVSKNPDSLTRFEREAVVLAQLSHPNILSIHDFGNFDGIPVAVMELLEGRTLRQAIDESGVTVRRSLEIGAEVAEGLAAAHSKGIVHRDLKPENIFITEDEQIKILDFGLARVEPAVAETEKTKDSIPTETEPGVIKGTIGYMAPEQLRGQVVDGRSDIFSLGCILYEMLTGQRAFAKASVADTMTAILVENPPDFLSSGRQLPPEAERLTTHCLEKNPERRYQSAKDLAMHLRSLASSPDISVGLRHSGIRRLPWVWALTALIATLVAVAALWLFLGRKQPSPAPLRPSVAVLYFENNTGDASLDWLRSALTNMLITDLSQSPQIEVLGTDRLYQILKELGNLEEPTVSFESVQRLARRASVKTVVLGSFVRAGETFRLSTRIQDAESGRILATERVEGEGESSIFRMVDELTRRIQSALEVSDSGGKVARDIESVTTSSFEAYRYYNQANELHAQSKEREAIPLLEKAVELDPQFAMALAKLSVTHWNLGHVQESHDYARRALEHVDRLPARERYYIEGRYYSLDPGTVPKAVEAYETAIALYPDHMAARHNLGNLYMALGRYDDAITQYEALLKAGSSFAGTHTNLANVYAQTGQVDKGYAVLKDYVAEYPDSAAGNRDLASYLIRTGRVADSFSYLTQAEVLAPGDFENKLLEWSAHVLTGDLAAAQVTAEAVATSSEPLWRSRAMDMRATLALYQGRLEQASSLIEQATAFFPEPGLTRANLLLTHSNIELFAGNGQSALQLAEQAYASARGYPVETDILATAACAQALLGQTDDARSTFEDLRTRYQLLPSRIVVRADNFLLGTMALFEKQYDEAVTRLEEAWSTYPEGINTFEETHCYVTGLAYWETGRRDEAAHWFLRLHEHSNERLGNPIGYVRSLYYLGRYHLDRGDREQGRHYLRRFLDLWGDGTLDRPLVNEARSLLKT
ncbi:MAG: protein kinase [Acidobacteriota bacterium]